MADKDRLRRRNARLAAEIEAMKPVVKAATDLIRGGYDGPFMGTEVEPLFQAVAAYEKTMGVQAPKTSKPPPRPCNAPGGGCINALVCDLSKKCLHAPESTPGHMTNE